MSALKFLYIFAFLRRPESLSCLALPPSPFCRVNSYFHWENRQAVNSLTQQGEGDYVVFPSLKNFHLSYNSNDLAQSSATTGSETEGSFLQNVLVERPSGWGGMNEDGMTFSIKGKCKRADSSEFFKRFTVSVHNSDKICITKTEVYNKQCLGRI